MTKDAPAAAVLFGGCGIQDASVVPVTVYKSSFWGFSRTQHRFCSEKAFLLCLFYNQTKSPSGRIFNAAEY